MDTLVKHLFSSFSEEDKTLASLQASCRDWLQSVRSYLFCVCIW